MNKIIKNLSIALLIFIFTFNLSYGEQFVRPNHFLDKKGWERTHEIKRFQALNNLTVTGKLDENTKTLLYNPKSFVKDTITNSPTTGRWIVINKTQRTLTMYNNDKPMYKFPVAIGTSQTPTPSVKGTIKMKAKNPAWGGMSGKYTPRAADDPLNPLGERWMGLNLKGYSGYGIHGTILPKQIGMNVSNGCIRMFNYDIETFIFPYAKVGMPVWIGTDAELRNWGVNQDWGIMEDVPAPSPTPAENTAPQTQPAEEISVEENLVF